MAKLSIKEFVLRYTPHANEVATKIGVPALVTLTQAALESGWNEHAPAFNFFGMKAGSTWKGAKQLLSTYEVVNGKRVLVKAYFRAYASATEAFLDYAMNLKTSDRYAAAFDHTNNPIKFLKAVIDAGYGTNPSYFTLASSVLNSIKKHVV